jgi:hypothetical protein
MLMQIRLERDEVYRLPEKRQVICVVAGAAWISLDNLDLLVDTGEQVVVKPGKTPALISAIGTPPLVYELR